MIFSLLILITIPFLIVLVGLLFEKKRKTFTRMAKASKQWLQNKEIIQYKYVKYFHHELSSSKHNFQNFNKSGFYYCNICKGLVGGICASKSLQCEVCGLIVHQFCKYKIKPPCKFICLVGEKSEFNHQWAEGNISINSKCSKCDLMCFTNYDLGGWSCLWCQRILHDECRDSYKQNCDLGSIRKHIICPDEITQLSVEVEINNNNIVHQAQDRKDSSDGEDIIGLLRPKSRLNLSKDTKFKLQIDKQKEPIIVVINKKSGGQSGQQFLNQFYRCLNPIQVISVIDEGLDRLQSFSKVKNLKILVAGGDGTVGSVLNYMRSGKVEDWKYQQPPVAILPLGTGNDLSRALGWGIGDQDQQASDIIRQVGMVDNIVHLDRWAVSIKQPRQNNNSLLGNISKIIKKQEDYKIQESVMYNYFGIGLDAQYCLDFHKLRSKQPNFFKSRIGNKFIYTQMGTIDYLMGKKNDLWKKVIIMCDQKEIPCPEGVENIVVLNINSWAGGVSDLWPISEQNYGQEDHTDGVRNRNNYTPQQPNFKPQRLGDGCLEVMGITSILHLGRIQVGFDTPVKICQGESIQIIMREASQQAMQIDGEPQAIYAPVEFNFKYIEKVQMLSRVATTMVNWETKLLKTMNWAQESELISTEAKQKILERMLQ